MQTGSLCAASGFFLIMGGWAGVMWIFLRALSLHLQICWQLVVGRNFMWFAQAVGWGIPTVGVVIAFILSGVSFRFGPTCHINHKNSLADLWIPLLVFAGLTIIIQFATFGYCIKVYLASLADNSASTEGSGMPSYTNSIRTMTPKQAYRRVRRVIALQWRGIAIVLIIVADVIFFSIIFVFQDNTVEAVKNDPTIAQPWIFCLAANGGDKSKCLDVASSLVVNMPTIGAVLFLLAVNSLLFPQSLENSVADCLVIRSTASGSFSSSAAGLWLQAGVTFSPRSRNGARESSSQSMRGWTISKKIHVRTRCCPGTPGRPWTIQ
jgi:hypothetical protein